MWIRSQDKFQLVNANSIKLIRAYKTGEDKKTPAVYDMEYDVILGFYNTEERALEVLDEIHEYIENEHMANLQKSKLLDSVYKNEISFNDFEGSVKKLKNVYEMPKE